MVFYPSLQICLGYISLGQNLHIISTDSRLHYSFKPQIFIELGMALPSYTGTLFQCTLGECYLMLPIASILPSFQVMNVHYHIQCMLLVQTTSFLHSSEVLFLVRFMEEDSFCFHGHHSLLFLRKVSAIFSLLPHYRLNRLCQ